MVELLEVNEQFIGQIADRIATNGPRCGGTDAMVEVETAEPAAPSCGDMRLRGQHNRAAALTKPSVNGLGSWSDKSMPGSTIAWAAGGLAGPLAAERTRMRPFGMAGQRGCPGHASPGRLVPLRFGPGYEPYWHAPCFCACSVRLALHRANKE